MTVTFTRADDPARPRGPRWRVAAGAVVVLLLVLAAVAVAVTAASSRSGASEVVTADPSALPLDEGPSGVASGPAGQAASASGAVFVHVLGQVVVPGLYEVPAGSRLVDVVAAAGGFTPEADQGGVNLARTVTDGEQVRVPAVGETPPEAGAAGTAGAAGAAGSTTSDPLVHLGTATAAELEALPGVGPATSAAILTWRDEHGGFRSVDDLLEVPGIGEKTLEKLRPLVAP